MQLRKLGLVLQESNLMLCTEVVSGLKVNLGKFEMIPGGVVHIWVFRWGLVLRVKSFGMGLLRKS